MTAVKRNWRKWPTGPKGLSRFIPALPDGSGALTAGTGLLAGTGQLGRAQERVVAEQAGDATPDGVQRLLSTYRWDADRSR